MKKIKLLLAAMAALVTMGVQAQSWTASEVGEGYFMLYNVGTGQYLTRGNGWGTQASITTTGTTGNGIALRFAGSGSDFKMFTGINGEAKGIEYLSGGTIYLDQANGKNSTWTFTQVSTDNGPVYTIVSKDNHGGGAGVYLTAGVDGTIVTPGADGTINGAKWKLMAIPAQPIGMDGASDTNPVDATSLIVNPNFSFDAIKKGDGWTMVSSNYNPCGGNVSGENVIYNPCAESWRAAFTLSQTITVPNGIYELTAQAAVTEYTATGADLPVVYANDVTTSFKAMTKGENSMAGVANNFTAGDYPVGPIRVVVTNGSLTIGVRGTRTDTWCVWDNFKLTYKGVDLSELKAALQAQIDAVPALQGTTTAAAYNAAKNYADGINMDNLTTEEQISTAATQLSTLVDAAKALQTSYARYNTIKTSATTIATGLDTTTPDDALDAATTNDAVEAAIATLRAAFLAELSNVTIPNDGYIDVTAVMVDNAGVHTNTDFWTIANLSATGGSAGVCNYGECEFYNRNFKFYQTLALTPGTWEFGVTGFHRGGQGDFSTYFYAGVDKILIPGVEKSVVNNMADAKTYFDNGNGKVDLKFLIEEAGNVEIGIDNQDTQTDKWTIFRDFTLKYYGAPDYSVYEDQWTALVAEATTAKTNHANVTGTELTALNEAIADSPVGSNLKATYNAKITALQNALSAFNTAAPSYDAYVAYRAETVSLFGEELANSAVATAPTSAAEAKTAIQNLNIAQYNKVASDYPYSLTSKIGDFSSWTGTAEVGTPRAAGTPNSLDWEHWSGVTHPYYEQDGNGYNNAGGWTIKYTKTTPLPAGSYVVKVAARSSAGVTSSVSVKDDKDASLAPTISLPCTGNRARGIAKDGKASWSDSDEFILENQGGGWEWRFVPFTLAAETEVTMTFYAEASSQYQWMSIGDGELLSATNIATAVAYNETANNTIEDEDVANVTITRTIKANYNTVVLPFDCTLGQVEAAFGTGTEVYAFSENSADANAITVNFYKVPAGTISANVPVLIKATAASNEQVFNGVQVVAPTADVNVAGTNIDFVGTYAPIAAIAEGDYFIGNGAIYKSAGNTSMKAFRAYLKVKNANAGNAGVKMFVDGIETGIDEINGTAVENGAIYNLAGQRVNKAQKGVFIVNGKKVIVK